MKDQVIIFFIFYKSIHCVPLKDLLTVITVSKDSCQFDQRNARL